MSASFASMQKKSDEESQFLKKLGDNINRIRKKKGLSYTALAYGCNMEKSNVIRIIKARTNPSAKVLRRLAKVLDVKTKDFFEGTD